MLAQRWIIVCDRCNLRSAATGKRPEDVLGAARNAGWSCIVGAGPAGTGEHYCPACRSAIAANQAIKAARSRT